MNRMPSFRANTNRITATINNAAAWTMPAGNDI